MINMGRPVLSIFLGKRWNSMTLKRWTTAKASSKNAFFNQERKLWERKWLDTVVVTTINNVDLGL
jgi:hypothetical protein